MSDLEFDRRFDPAYGEAVPAGENVARLTVNNPSPFTFHGTNSYIVGRDTLAVIDPGPEDEAHFQALLAAIGGRPVSHIFVSHTHADHSPLTARLKEATGAIVAALVAPAVPALAATNTSATENITFKLPRELLAAPTAAE